MSVFKNFILCQDAAINTLIRLDGEYGLPNEWLSARAWRKRDKCPRFHAFVNALFFVDYEWRDGMKIQHCQLAFEKLKRLEYLPEEYR